jgi:hypothetical protein
MCGIVVRRSDTGVGADGAAGEELQRTSVYKKKEIVKFFER